jgi:hypothetical protein
MSSDSTTPAISAPAVKDEQQEQHEQQERHEQHEQQEQQEQHEQHEQQEQREQHEQREQQETAKKCDAEEARSCGSDCVNPSCPFKKKGPKKVRGTGRFRNGKEIAKDSKFCNPYLLSRSTLNGFLRGFVCVYLDGDVEVSLVNSDDATQGWTFVGALPGAEVFKAFENNDDYSATIKTEAGRGPIAVTLKGPKPKGTTPSSPPFGANGVTISLTPVSGMAAFSIHALGIDERLCRMAAEEDRKRIAKLLRQSRLGALLDLEGGGSSISSITLRTLSGKKSDDDDDDE